MSSSGDEDDSFQEYREDSNDPEQTVGDVIKRKNQNAVKARVVEGKENNTDMRSVHLPIMVNFCKNDDGVTFLSLPKLPAITGPSYQNVIDDYSKYPGKASNFYADTEKRFKTSNKPLPRHKKEFQCELCDWSFDSIQKLTRHRDTHTDMGTFACQVCHSLFNHQYNMYHHWRNSCTLLTSRRSDLELSSAEVISLRTFVLCVMGMDNRAQQFHVTGGVMYLPSAKFLANRYNVNMPAYSGACHLCSLHVPTKFMECHGDVHRGRYRIDGKIYDDYYCHICSRIFEKKQTLIRHWRFQCEEMIAFTPDEEFLDDDELTALAWLVLQQTVPQRQIDAMTGNSQQMIERWTVDHARKLEQKSLVIAKKYYHFPQEIWPLQTQTDLDLIHDSFPVKEQTEINCKTSKLAIHGVNLLATCSPDFYATGMTFCQLVTSQQNPSDPKCTYRIILRYTMNDSIISTYKFNHKTCPRLRPTHPKFNTEKQTYQCEKCENVKKNKHCLLFSNEARCEAHKENLHSRLPKRKDYWCVLCHRVLYIRSAEEHWESKCVPIQLLIEDPEDRKYVDLAFAEYVQSKVFAKLKIKLVLKPPEGREDEEMFAPTHKRTMKEGYFWWRTGEIRERVENQSDDIHVSLTNLEQMPKAREMIRSALAQAKDRYEKQMNPREHFKSSKAVILICPHCGGRFHIDLLLQHLQLRHFYPERHQSVRNLIASWRQSGFKNTIRLFGNLVREMGETISPLMSENSYRNCIEYNFKNGEFSLFDGDWQRKPTVHRLEEVDEVAIIDLAQQASILANAIVAPDPVPELTQFCPNTVELDEPTDPEAVKDTWLPADPNVTVVEREKIDPVTNKVLSPELSSLLSEIDAKFCGDFWQEAWSNGVDIDSVTNFWRNPNRERPREATEKDKNPYVDYTDFDPIQTIDIEKIKKAIAEDAELEPYKSSEDDTDNESDHIEIIENEVEETVQPAENGKPEEENEETERQRKRQVKLERKKQKQESRNAPPPVPYDEAAFAMKKVKLDPAKYKSMQYLTTGCHTSSDQNEIFDGGRPLGLSVAYENSTTDFRTSGMRFRRYYKSNMLVTNRVDGKLQSQLSRRDQDMSKTHEEMVGDKSTPSVVVDEKGFAYVGGYTKSGNFDFENKKKFHVTKNGKAKKMQTFSSEDEHGQFRHVWPDEKISKIGDQKDLKLSRLEVVPLDEPVPRPRVLNRMPDPVEVVDVWDYEGDGDYV